MPDPALDAPILVLGAPRSGTTWLAKIIDSHPDVLYRHEPDRAIPPPALLAEAAVPGLLAAWAANREPRSAGKRPFFRKSWQTAPAFLLRSVLAGALGAAGHPHGGLRRLATLPIPDFATHAAPRLLIKSIDWGEGAAALARTMPDSRIVLILRHPCGQVASVMRGNRQRRFDLATAGTDMPFDEAKAIGYAAAHGLAERAFQALPDAAKYAWSWRAFNEPAYAALAPLGNVHVVLYEALCANPEPQAREILSFAGLHWNSQTARFVTRSTTGRGRAGYYAVYRDAIAAADFWRRSMPAADIEAVRSVVRLSPLARLWPDLVSA